MDFVTRLQNGIDYVEKHMTGKIDFDEVAKQAKTSNFHFQRIFNIAFGYSLTEYIRFRRLFLAGVELAQGGGKIMNISLKYGYETQETFARTFAKFHGIKPAAAKRGEPLKDFPAVSVEQIEKASSPLEYRIEDLDEFDVVLRKKRFSKMQDVTAKDVSKFWNECNGDGTVKALCKYLPEDNEFDGRVLGISFNADSNLPNNNFPYGIGVPNDGEKILENYLTTEKVPENTYVVFECKGKLSESFPKAYKYIYTEFFTTSEYMPCGVELESYPFGDRESEDYAYEIWIAVKKKG